MAKKSGTSWLTVVKRAFRSPTKDAGNKSSRRDENEQEDEEKREKRRWIFRKSSGNVQQCEEKRISSAVVEESSKIPVVLGAEQRHAIAVAAAASAAAAEVAVASAKAAVEMVRSTNPSKRSKPSNFREHCAAIAIQTAFRGYLARRALRALKGLVKLQALVRGQNVRKQVKLTLKCMQSLVRVQDHVRHQRARLSHEGSRRSMFVESNSLWDSINLKDIRNRKSMSRETYRTAADEWDDCPNTSNEIEAMLQSRKEAALKREKALAYAFSQQIWRSRTNPSIGKEEELEERTKWLERWMATKQQESSERASTDRRDSNIRTVEIDTSRPYYSSAANGRTVHLQPKNPTGPHLVSSSSPLQRTQFTIPLTPSPSKPKPVKIRSASPRCPKEEKSYSAAQTPSLCFNGGIFRYGVVPNGDSTTSAIPNYMAATESAKARARPQSAPKQRPSTPERERSGSVAKKRLAYPVIDPYNNSLIGCSQCHFSQNLRSPSFKSVQTGYYGMENLSCCYTDSFGRDVSPCSTTDLRWLR
ncbi:hypothetical protein UlMin_001690 [Ulmus minor]